MSATVDSRVVEMHFDNEDFMSKIQETIDALEKLNDQIATLNASKGLGQLTDGIEKNDLSGVEESVSNIENRFSTLGVVGMTVLQRITNAGINMGLKIGGSIKAVADQIKSGGFVRAQNIEQAKFLLEGLHANVTSIMNDVNYAVEGTAYGLDEAAKSSAVFFAAGVKQGDEMKTALRAISGVAAMTGSSYSGMAEVFQDAAGKGAFMTQELRRIQAQGVAADKYLIKFFDGINDGSIKASKAVTDSVKEITNGTKTSGEELEKLLRDGKINFQVFAEAMDNAFGEHATEANKTFSGSLANMKTALSRLGEAFISPAMKAAIPLFNSIQGAIKSFTSLLKAQGGVLYEYAFNIKKMGEGLSNAIDRANELYVFSEIGRIVASAFRILMNAVDAFKDVFKDVFPAASIENVGKIVHRIADLASAFSVAHKNLTTFRNILTIIFSAFKIAGNIISGVIKIMASFLSTIFNLTDGVGSLSEMFANFMKTLADKSGTIGIFDTISTAINKAGQSLQKGVSLIINGITDVLSTLSGSVGQMRDFTDAFTVIGGAWTSLFLYTKWGRMIEGLKGDFSSFFHIFDNMGAILEAPARISKSLGSLMDTLKSMQHEIHSKILRNLALSILMLAVSLKTMASIDSGDLAKTMGAVTLLMAELVGMVQLLTMIAMASDSIKGIYAIGSVTNTLIKIGVSLVLIASALKIISSIDPQQLASGLIGLTIIMGALLGFTIAISKYSGSEAKIASIGLMLMEMGVALNLLASAVTKISSLDPISLAKGLSSIVILMGAIFGLSAGISKVGAGGAAGMIAAGAGMVLMAAAINILVPALQKLGSMKLSELAKGLISVAAALTVMAAASQFMNLGGAAGFLVMALGIAALATAIQRLGELDVKTLATSIIAMAVAMGVLLAAAAVATAVIPGLIALGAAMLVMSASIAILGAGLIMIGAGLTAVSAGILSFASISQTALLMFTNVVKVMLSTLLSLMPMVVTTLAESFVGFVEKIAELAPRFTQAMTTIIAALLKAIEDNVPVIINCGFKLITSFLSSLSNNISRISALGVEIIAGFIQGISDQISTVISAGMNLMLAFINGLAEGIRAHKGDVRDAIINLCTAILEAFCSFFGIASPSTVMKQQGVNLITGLAQGIKSAASKAKTAMLNACKSVLNSVKSLASKFKSVGIAFVTNLKNGITQRIKTIASAFKSGISYAVQTVKSYASKFADAGRSLVSGIASGIRNGFSSVISAVGSIASSAISHFKSKLGINSPSKEFAKLAIGIPEGIVKGVRQGSLMVKKAVGRLSDTALKSMAETIRGSAEELQNGSDFNPTITPVLDLSDVIEKRSQLSNLLADQTMSLAYQTNNAAALNDRMAFQTSMNNLISQFKKISNDLNSRPNNITNNMYVDGSENPEAFASRFVRQLQMEMRMR